MSKEKKLIREELKKITEGLKDDIRFELSKEIRRRMVKVNNNVLEEQKSHIDKVYEKLHAKIVNGYLEQFNTVCEKTVHNVMGNNNLFEHEVMKTEETHRHELLKKLNNGWRIAYFGPLLDKNNTSTNYIIISKLKSNNEPVVNIKKKKVKRNPSK